MNRTNDAGPSGLRSLHLLSADATVRDAVAALEAASPKLIVIVAGDGRLIRTVTDGDIRRGLLAGIEFQDGVTELPGRDPVTVKESDPLEESQTTLLESKVDTLVAVNESGEPVALHTASDLGQGVLLSPPHMGPNERRYVDRAFDENWIAPAGPNLAEFEKKLSAVTCCDEVLAVSSGTAALHLALRVLGVSAGDRVYVSDLTFVASVQPILYQGATPVLIDSEPVGWNISPIAIRRKLTEDAKAGQLPKAIIVVHIYGQNADIEPILAAADEYGVPVVEDAAESLGASYHNRASGSHGRLSAYSFNGNKIITTSGGGALATDSPALIDRARKLSTQGRDDALHYQHSDVAYNYRMSNVLAGIGIGQLDSLQDRVAARRKVFERYRSGLEAQRGISFQADLPGASGNRWLTVIRLDPRHIHLHPYQLMARLKDAGIETRPGWKPMHLQPLCAGFEFVPHDEQRVISSTLFLQTLCLPSGSSLAQATQNRIITQIRKVLDEG
ncbi:DegT/DnrJ/EryC1/StrS family aminotransferase [Altererythrobacter sp. MF3-039]|uniref:DegT/DnrJ/EryC1/StrS family aminotransferase n=1 Tax=Altererythrobacter sp. MF3-039 TaxID=3252901 RepID=UPI00390CBBEC